MTLGFCNNLVEFSTREAIVPNDFKNAICYGQTGSGKTTGFMLPAIKDRMDQNYGLVVFDFKGTLQAQIKALALEKGCLEKIVEIGPLWGKKINLIKDISVPELSHLYLMMHGGSKDPYWVTSSNNVVMNLYGVLKTLNAMATISSPFGLSLEKHEITLEEPSFKVLHRYFSSPSLLSKLISSSFGVHKLFFKLLQESMPERFFFLYKELEGCLSGLGEYEDFFDWKEALEDGKILIISSQELNDLSLACISSIIGKHLASRIRKSNFFASCEYCY